MRDERSGPRTSPMTRIIQFWSHCTPNSYPCRPCNQWLSASWRHEFGRSLVAGWIVVAIFAVVAGQVRGEQARQLWLYCPTNLLVNENVEKLDVLWRRAAKVGYTHMLVGDTKFCRLGEMPKEYFRNVERVK